MPRLHRGDTLITRIHRGDTLITRIHRGSDLVYSPGEFMFAYATSTSSPYNYTMCVMDIASPDGARSLYDFTTGTDALHTGFRHGDLVYIVDAGRKVSTLPRTGSGTVSPTNFGTVPLTQITNITGMDVDDTHIYVGGVFQDDDTIILTSSLTGAPAWSSADGELGRYGGRMLAMSESHIFALTESNELHRWPRASGTQSETDLGTFTPNVGISDVTNIRLRLNICYEDGSVFIPRTDGSMARLNSANDSNYSYTNNIGTIAVNGSSDPGVIYKLFGSQQP